MKRFTLLTFLLFAFFGAFAQTITVKSFQALPMDMTAASLKGKRIDQNGQVAALIKIVTTETGFTFEGGTLGIVDSKQENGEVWVWVPRASRKITIKHQQLGVLRDYRYPIEIESERTYEMVLTTGKVETIVKPEVTQQYLAFQISPADAELEVDGEIWPLSSRGTARQRVDEGEYHYRITALKCEDEESTVTVADTAVMVTVTLKPISKKPTNKPIVETKEPEKETKQPKTEPPVVERFDGSAFFVMANAAYSIAPQTSFGITVGSVKKLGWYASLGSNFKYRKADYVCDYSGTINGATFEYSYSGEISTSRFGATAGMVVRISDPVYAYVGGGYGFRNVFWELESGEWVKCTDFCYSGISLDAGLMLHFSGLGLSLGVQTIGFKYMEAKIGLGYTLKRK